MTETISSSTRLVSSRFLLPRGDIRIVKAEIPDLHLLHELERRVDARFCTRDVVVRLVPGTEDGHVAEGVRAAKGKRMPPAHRKTQMVFHRFSGDDLVRIVILERKRVFAPGAFVLHGSDLLKICHCLVRSFDGVPMIPCRVYPPAGVTRWI
jgi:hypothetical protein